MQSRVPPRSSRIARHAERLTPAWRGEFVATTKLATPLAAANLLQMAVYAVDVIFIARLGKEALAASALAVAIFGLLIWALNGLVSATAALLAAEFGRHGYSIRAARRIVRMGVWLGILSGAVGMVLCGGSAYLLLATGQDPAIVARSDDFMRILMWAMIPSVVATVLRIFVSALGRAGIATFVTFLAVIVSALGNYLLVFGNWGFPALGIEGSAISNVITGLFMVAAYVVIIQRDRLFRRYHLFGYWWRGERGYFFDLIRIGFPVTIAVVAEAGLFNGSYLLVGRMGDAELAGHAITMQVAALVFQIPFGIAQAATIRVGLGYGARDHAWIARAGSCALLLGAVLMFTTAVLCWTFPRTILSAYIDVEAARNAAMVSFALQYLVVAAAFQIFDGLQAVGMGVLRGLQDTRTPMLMAVFGYWAVGAVVAVVLGFYTALAGVGVWIGFAAGLIVVSGLLLLRWHWRGRLDLLPQAKS